VTAILNITRCLYHKCFSLAADECYILLYNTLDIYFFSSLWEKHQKNV